MDSSSVTPEWLWTYLGIPAPREGQQVALDGRAFVVREGMLREMSLATAAQAQTAEAFGFKWQKRDSYDSPRRLARTRTWLRARYGNVETAPWLAEHGPNPLVIDAGCGAGVSALELLGSVLSGVRYLGIDISAAVDVARERFRERGLPATFMQADISDLPFPARSADIVFSEGVLHHTGSTEASLKSLSQLLRPGGRFLFYVYRRKGPIREFSDDYIRHQLRSMRPEQAWRAVESLTRLGVALGELDAEIDLPEPVDLLQIPAGRISVQRLFYWHVAKAFYDPELTPDEMNHINFDWYAPLNAHRQSPEEVRAWCAEAALEIESEVVEDAGMTVTARKRA